MNPSTPAKTAYGLILAGVSFLVLVWSARHPDANGLTNIWWFVLAYFVLEVGEMLLSPIGLSAVTELSVPSVVSLMMGGWFLGTSYSEVLAAELGKLSSIEIPEGETINVIEALSKYDALFVYSAKIGIICGIVVLVVTPAHQTLDARRPLTQATRSATLAVIPAKAGIHFRTREERHGFPLSRE